MANYNKGDRFMTKREDAWERLEEIKDDIRKLNILASNTRDWETSMGIHRLIILLNKEKKILKKEFYGVNTD